MDTTDRQPSIILICLLAFHCSELLLLVLVSIVASAAENTGSTLSESVGVDMAMDLPFNLSC